jgi:hypothetical protein
MSNPNKGPKEAERPMTAFQETFWANVMVWGFLAGIALVTYVVTGGVWDDVTRQTLKFIFGIFGGGFTLVSVLDALYDKYVSTETPKS